jgi:hypothetical protein
MQQRHQQEPALRPAWGRTPPPPTSSLSFRPSLMSGMPLRKAFITSRPCTSHRRTLPCTAKAAAAHNTV